MNRSELKKFLKEIGASPKKALSQNFLIDANIVRKILQIAEVQPGDRVLEIGPGPGALTEALLQKGASVFAIEKDRLFASSLSRLQTEDGRFFVFCEDALAFPFDKLPSSMKVVANLPYHITTPLLERLFAEASRFSSFTLMVQSELAQRIRAVPKTAAFGSLTLFTQAHTLYRTHFKVSASCFYPRPKVDSTVLRLDRRLPSLDLPPSFFILFRRAFQQRRKMLRVSLQKLFPAQKIKEVLERTGIELKARPEELSLDEWIKITDLLTL